MKSKELTPEEAARIKKLIQRLFYPRNPNPINPIKKNRP
jgi:hypothetical protein